jgi:hypothetical protein
MQNDREVSLLAAEVGQERSRPLVILHVVQDFSPAEIAHLKVRTTCSQRPQT